MGSARRKTLRNSPAEIKEEFYQGQTNLKTLSSTLIINEN